MARKNVRLLRGIRDGIDVFDWTPFRGCDNHDGLYNVLRDPSSAEQPLRGEKVQLFRGSRDRIHDSATHGCAFAKLLDRPPGAYEKKYDVFFLLRVDEGGPTEVRLLAILRDGQEPSQGWYFAVATVLGMTKSRVLILALGDPASSVVLPDGPISPDPVSSRSLRIMDMWLCCCSWRIGKHEQCPAWEVRKSPFPNRLIDVMAQVPRLYMPSPNETARYATLSHC
jgi:hypothetical protein